MPANQDDARSAMANRAKKKKGWGIPPGVFWGAGALLLAFIGGRYLPGGSSSSSSASSAAKDPLSEADPEPMSQEELMKTNGATNLPEYHAARASSTPSMMNSTHGTDALANMLPEKKPLSPEKQAMYDQLQAEKKEVGKKLEMMMTLANLTELASKLTHAGVLDEEAVAIIDGQLEQIRETASAMKGGISVDMEAAISVVKGTIHKRAENLTDEQVESLYKSSTYSNPNYWQELYDKKDSAEKFDWYAAWDYQIVKLAFEPLREAKKAQGETLSATSMGGILKPYLGTTSKILNVGCGNSDLSEKMYAAGFEDILNVDISKKLLDSFRTRLADVAPRMRWEYMNVSSLDLKTGTFDVVIEKGTLDAIEGNRGLSDSAIKEIHRVLRPGGVLLSITFTGPDSRVERHLKKQAAWSECRTHSFFPKEERHERKSQWYLHACLRA